MLQITEQQAVAGWDRDGRPYTPARRPSGDPPISFKSSKATISALGRKCVRTQFIPAQQFRIFQSRRRSRQAQI
jgi:hypothetical protein